MPRCRPEGKRAGFMASPCGVGGHVVLNVLSPPSSGTTPLDDDHLRVMHQAIHQHTTQAAFGKTSAHCANGLFVVTSVLFAS